MRTDMGIPAPGVLNLTGVSGDSWSVDIHFKQEDGTDYPVDHLTWESGATDGGLVVLMHVDATNAATGHLVITATPDQTANKSGKYRWYLQSLAAGGSVRTWLIGTIDVVKGAPE